MPEEKNTETTESLVKYVTADQTSYMNDAWDVFEEVLSNYIWGVHIDFQDESIQKEIEQEISLHRVLAVDKQTLIHHPKVDDKLTMEHLLGVNSICDSIICDCAYACRRRVQEKTWTVAHAVLVSHMLSVIVADITKPYSEYDDAQGPELFPAPRLPKEGELLR